MKKMLFAALMLASVSAQSQVPAFPGCEGYGRYTQGGRASDGTTHVYHVTNLNDSGEGSLRWALGQAGPRTIVFDVGGYIDLQSNLKINSNTTVAGQTAPAPGITIRYYTVELEGSSNVIMRFIRVRRSQVKNVNDGADACWGRRGHDIVLDHCSFSWCIDEVGSFYDNKDFTMQWCYLEEALANAGHDKGAHSYGGIRGGKGATFHHNFIAHVHNRAPRINSARYNWQGYDKTKFISSVDAERVDLRNCLMYNWGNSNGAYGNMGGYLNIVNNYYQAGPATKNKTRVFQCSKNSSKDSGGALPDGLPGRFYINGNYVSAASASDRENYDWNGVIADFSWTDSKKKTCLYDDVKCLYNKKRSLIEVHLTEEVPMAAVSTHGAVQARDAVLTYGGSSLYPDEVDQRIIEECKTGTTTYHTEVGTTYNGIIDKINDPAAPADSIRPSFPELTPTAREEGFDTDQDGMPDAFETAHNLNPNDPADANTKTLDTYYSNLEVYLHSLVADIMTKGVEATTNTIAEHWPLLATPDTPGDTPGDTPQTPVELTDPTEEERHPGTDMKDTQVEAVPDPEPEPEPEPEPSEQPGEKAIKVIAHNDHLTFRYFDLQGRPIAQPGRGISIRQTIHPDGRVESDLVIKE